MVDASLIHVAGHRPRVGGSCVEKTTSGGHVGAFDCPGPQFLLIMYLEIALYVVFVAVGVLNCKRPRIHRPMMLMASLSILSGATARIPLVNSVFWGSHLDGIVWAGCRSRSSSPAGVLGSDPHVRAGVCAWICCPIGGVSRSDRAGADGCVGQLRGDDFEALTKYPHFPLQRRSSKKNGSV